MNDNDAECETQEKGLDAPRFTSEQMETLIASEYYHVPEGTTLTICVLTLRNETYVVGHSTGVNPRNFDKELGRRLARQRAKYQIWELEGYLLNEAIAGRVSFRLPRR